MRRVCLIPAVVAAAGLAAGPAVAQPPPGPSLPPAFSPYLNLVNGRGLPGINYYGITRPQLAARQAILGLETGVMQNRQAIAGMQAGGVPGAGLPGTGHATVFMNTGGYFMSGGTAAPGAVGRMTPNLGGVGGANRMGLRPTNRVNAGAGRP